MVAEEIVARIKDRGYAVVEGVLTPEHCKLLTGKLEQLSDQFSPKYHASGNTVNVHGQGDVRLVYNLHNKGREFLDLIFDPTVLEVAGQLLSAGSYGSKEPFQLALSQARGLYGTHPRQQLHIDSYIPGLEQILVLQAGWALSEFKAGGGSTCFVEGSHRQTSFPENGKDYPMSEIVAPAGSLVLFNGSMWHGSSVKADEAPRWGIFNRYSRWFMRPSFEHTDCTPSSVYRELTDSQREILGFRFKSPRDEFTRVTRISPQPEFTTTNYLLPRDEAEAGPDSSGSGS